MHVSLITKVTRLCNLRCSYCNDWRIGRGQTMSYKVMLTMTTKVLQDPLHNSVDFIWHGGEPTLLGRSFFKKAIHAQARLRRPNQTITNSLQTNATLLDDDWAHFLRDNRFAISVSLDGPAFIHDDQRPYRSGRSSSSDVRWGLDILRKHEIPISALLVVDRQTLDLGPDIVFDFFVDQGIKSFGLLAAKPKNAPYAGPNSSSEHYVRPAEMGRFLSCLFNRWITHGDPTIRIREFDTILKRILGKEAPACVLAGQCFGSYFLIEPQGEVAHCDLFLGDPGYTLGNIVSDSFADLRSSPAMKALQANNRAAVEMMRVCPNFSICNGWCPHERYTAFRHDPEFSRSCCGLGGLIDHIRARVSAPIEATAVQREPELE